MTFSRSVFPSRSARSSRTVLGRIAFHSSSVRTDRSNLGTLSGKALLAKVSASALSLKKYCFRWPAPLADPGTPSHSSTIRMYSPGFPVKKTMCGFHLIFRASASNRSMRALVLAFNFCPPFFNFLQLLQNVRLFGQFQTIFQ